MISIKKPIFIFTAVWGDMVQLYDTVLMRSLFQGGNIPALVKSGHRIEFHVHVLPDNIDFILETIKKYQEASGIDCSNLIVKINPLTTEKRFLRKSRISIENAVIQTATECINNNALFLMACPDHFFGNNSIMNLVKLNMNRNLCIAGVHLRVDETKFLDFLEHNKNEISNPELVSLSMELGHSTLYDAFITKEMNSSYISGISIQEMNNNLYSVTHRLPAIWLANFIKKDLKLLSKNFSNYDHKWPSDLMSEKRFKLVGSSDLFYAVELTKSNSHLCKLEPHPGNDDYQSDTVPHKEINRNFVVVLRGQEVKIEVKL